MSTYFKEITFSKEVEGVKFLKRSKWRAFIPGINSGVYKPASICFQVRIEYWTNKLFRFTKTVSNAEVTLSRSEFNDLYEEMTKIKNLRDNDNISGK
jgi:hypothetical protein